MARSRPRRPYIPIRQRYGGKARQLRVAIRIEREFQAEMAELERQHLEAMQPWIERMKYHELRSRKQLDYLEKRHNRSRWQKFVDWILIR